MTNAHGLTQAVVHPCGDTALLVEVADLGQVFSLHETVRERRQAGRLPGLLDVVPAARTLLLVAGDPTGLPKLREELHILLRHWEPPDAGAPITAQGPVVRISVSYNGPDLDGVASLTGLSSAEVVAAHTGRPWTVAFGGFAPGFSYLVGGDPRLHVPRQQEPRVRVPAGAVGLAGPFSGVYPRPSPGGWQIIGQTDAVLWDVDRDPPGLLQPGATVQFVDMDAARADAEPGRADAEPGRADAESGRADADHLRPTRGRYAVPGPSTEAASALHAELEVLETGPLALLQDLGRPGLAAYGVGRSGAADRGAFLLGARLLGQGPAHAAVEVTYGGLAVRARGSVTVVLTGAPAPATVDDLPAAHAAPFLLRAGQVLRLGPPATGLRTYLSVRGGIAAQSVLGSRATDTLSGIGPAPLQPGDVLPVEPPVGEPTVDVAPVRAPTDGVLELRAVLGPHHDWLLEPLALEQQTWAVSSRSDRVGLRLEGSSLERSPSREGDELPSEGVVRGAVQVPPGGQPVLFLADHPVTGGYPVVAVVVDTDIDRAAQAVPGQRVRLRLQRP